MFASKSNISPSEYLGSTIKALASSVGSKEGKRDGSKEGTDGKVLYGEGGASDYLNILLPHIVPF